MTKNHSIIVEREIIRKEMKRYSQSRASKNKVLYRKIIIIPRHRQIEKRNPIELRHLIIKNLNRYYGMVVNDNETQKRN